MQINGEKLVLTEQISLDRFLQQRQSGRASCCRAEWYYCA